MRSEDSECWSSLQTVSSFDPGNASTVNCNTGGEVLQFSLSSLLVESLIGQLCKLIESDPVHQKQLYMRICKKLHQMKLIDESYDLEEFETLRSSYQKALYQLVTVARNANKTDKKAVMTKPNNKICLKSELLLEWSRYTTEYEELDFIARGGFGEVFRARNKLDREIYAVKKIYLRYCNANGFMQNLAEVKLLARLNHPNIVAYKAAWLEPIDPSKGRRHIFPDTDQWVIETSEKQDSSGGIVFESSDPSNTTSEDRNNRINNLAIIKKTKDVLEFRDHTPFIHYPQEWACLYIQMQMCEVTLRQWLDNRNLSIEPIKETQYLALFKQVVQGVEYIHSQGIVHHDIKPSNVFVSEDLRQVQVGDFGLACSLMTHNPEVAVVPSHGHHSLRGTRLYAAPEQLNGLCTPKSDIYSLGIVLMELIQPFQTDMERSKVIGRLKAGHVPPELSNSFPILVKAMSQCIYHSPNKRPSARELLELIENEDLSNFARIVAEKDATIQRLNKEMLAKESEIAELKRLLLEQSLPNSPDSYSPPVQFI